MINALRGWLVRRWNWFLAGAILLVSVLITAVMISVQPEPARRTPVVRIPIAITVPAQAGVGAIPVFAAGTVRPSAEVEVAVEISGKVVWVDPVFRSGGRVSRGQALFRIDDADYRNRVQQARAAVAARQVALTQAEENARIRTEYAQARSRQADNEFRTDVDALSLEQYQLEVARIDLAWEQTALVDAELALSRVQVHAPFDAVVQEEAVEPGKFVEAGQGVGRLYATEAVDVVVPITDADADLLPGLWELEAGDGDTRYGARVIAEYGAESYAWDGYLDRVAASLDEQTRTIDVIVRVPYPFAGGKQVGAEAGADIDPDAASNSTGPPLLVGKFVEVEIQGNATGRYFIVPPQALRPGNEVWALRVNTVTIVPVHVLQRSDNKIYITGALTPGQALVTGGIQVATEGMEVRAVAGDDL